MAKFCQQGFPRRGLQWWEINEKTAQSLVNILFLFSCYYDELSSFTTFYLLSNLDQPDKTRLLAKFMGFEILEILETFLKDDAHVSCKTYRLYGSF